MPEYKKPKMTNWYNPSQLIDTGKRTFISTTVGRYADPRAGMPDPTLYDFFDYSKHLLPGRSDFKLDDEKADREEIWIDYAADVGDGFNSTYAVAYYMAQPSLPVAGVRDPLPRGEILFFGGDGVYPTANFDRYEKQLVTPYRMAFKSGLAAGPSPVTSELAQHPHIFALPGNHDWYDSLVAFKELFCSHIFNYRKFADDSRTQVGGWRTRQRRSYFTLKLPQHWWLLAVDLQLTHNVDVSQLEYFESVIKRMDEGDKVILCVPEPYWEKYIKYQGVTDKYEEKERSIGKLDRYFADRKIEVKAFIAGDLHHYRHFQKDGVHKITAGGGGAFLHPTHDFDFRKAEKRAETNPYFKGFSFVDEYPHYDVSRRMGWRDFGFLFHNLRFGLMTAVIYFVLALLVQGRISGTSLNWYDPDFWAKSITATIDRVIQEPLVMFVMALLLLGLVFFTDTESKWQRWFGGLLHGMAHLLAAFVLGWAGYLLSIWISTELGVPVPSGSASSTWYNVIWLVSVLVVSVVGGYIVGSFIMGIYLYISLHVFGRHSNEAFSALKIQDYKNFLRMHIDREGGLTIYPIKIEKVPRNWKEDGEFFTPSGGTVPALIEDKPIVVR